MALLEQIVRPFQSPGVINDKKTRITRVVTVSKTKAILRWGSSGSAPETKQVGIKVTVKGADVSKTFTQENAKTRDVRVENPTDSSQFIITQRIEEIKFSRPKPYSDKVTGQPTNEVPGNQKPDITATGTGTGTGTVAPSSFTDGSGGTTITKTESGLTTTYVDGNTNTTATSTAGSEVTAVSKKTEMNTFILNWDKTESAGE